MGILASEMLATGERPHGKIDKAEKTLINHEIVNINFRVKRKAEIKVLTCGFLKFTP